MDKYRIDNHKLIYHPKRVSDWLAGKDIYPLYIEISLCSSCNHRCIFCAFDYLGHKPQCLDYGVLKKFLKEISGKSVKSILFSGEGEPLLYRGLPQIVSFAKKSGLDVALTSNATLLSKDISRQIIPHLTWLRVSLNAGSAKVYSFVHGTGHKDFRKVINNLGDAVKIKKLNRYNCTIGAQLLLLNENYKEAVKLAKILKEIGVDYLIIKPYSQHPLSINHLKLSLNYDKLLSIENQLDKYNDAKFKIILRKNTMLKINVQRSYKKCFGFSFYAHLTAEGDLYACSSSLGDERFCYGNIYRSSFDGIWKGEKRKKVIRIIENNLDVRQCREVCRLDEINRYLWELKYPSEHVNFI